MTLFLILSYSDSSYHLYLGVGNVYIRTSANYSKKGGLASIKSIKSCGGAGSFIYGKSQLRRLSYSMIAVFSALPFGYLP